MTWYTIFPDSDKAQAVDGSSITGTSTNINGGSASGLGVSIVSGGVITSHVGFGNKSEAHGSKVIQSKDVFGIFQTSAVTITSVADNGSGFCRYTLNTHGLDVGTVINVVGSTSQVNDGPQTIRAITINTFDTDRPYVAAVTAGDYTLVAGRFASMTIGEYIVLGYTSSVAGGQAIRTGYGSDYGIRRSIHKIEAMRTLRVATAIRNGQWNVYSGSWTTNPTSANDISDWGTDNAANPTRAIPGELVYRTSGMPDGTYGVVQEYYPVKTS